MTGGRRRAPSAHAPDLFTVLCGNELGCELVKEYRFHPTRKWRFDYAIPALKIAVECDGGVWTGGRHVSPQGYIRDMEKINEAQAAGWIVLRFTPQQLITQETITIIRRTIKQRINERAMEASCRRDSRVDGCEPQERR